MPVGRSSSLSRIRSNHLLTQHNRLRIQQNLTIVTIHSSRRAATHRSRPEGDNTLADSLHTQILWRAPLLFDLLPSLELVLGIAQ